MHVDRPLGLTELLAETVRLYGERIWAVAGIGIFLAGSLLAAGVLVFLKLDTTRPVPASNRETKAAGMEPSTA